MRGEGFVGSRILREIRKRGYDGSRSALYTFLKQLKAEETGPAGMSPLRDRSGAAGAVRLEPVHGGPGRGIDTDGRILLRPGVFKAQTLQREPGYTAGFDIRGH